MNNEAKPNLTLFFRRFLNTPEEMDAHLGFKGGHEKASEKDPRVLFCLDMGCKYT
jgi:hypothetical protein